MATKATATDTLDLANRALSVMGGYGERATWLSRGNHGRLWVHTRHGSAAAVLSRSGQFLGCNYGRLGMGHTEATAVAQIVRWVRGLPRYPLRVWGYWSGSSGRLFPARMVSLLGELGYETPEACGCVLCGKHPTIGIDWYHLAGTSGHCCPFVECREW